MHFPGWRSWAASSRAVTRAVPAIASTTDGTRRGRWIRARHFPHSFPGSQAALLFPEQARGPVHGRAGAALARLPLGERWGEWALEKGPAAARQWAFHVVTALASNLPGAASWAVFTVACSALAMYAVELYDLRQAIADRSRGGRRAWIALTLVAIGLAIRAEIGRASCREREESAGG